MELYREWCLKPEQRRGCMLPLRRIDDMMKAPDAGYASNYMFDKDAATQILAERSSAGLARFPVYADTLVLDLDGGDAQLKQAIQALAEQGLGYVIEESGGKGYHVTIPLAQMLCGKNVPYTQRKWVEALGIGADLTLYQHGRIISLPGRVHPKTGRRKRRVKTVLGKALDLQLIEMPEPSISLINDQSEAGQLAQGLWRAFSIVTNEPAQGQRHTNLWSTAKHFADAGLEFDTVLDLMMGINALWQAGKDGESVRLAVTQAFQKRRSPIT